MHCLVKDLRQIKAQLFLLRALQSLRRSVVAKIGVLLCGSFAPVFAQSVPVTVGYRDFSYGSTPAAEITGEKPQSKLWWNDGYWWGSLWANSTERYRIHRFDLATQSWINTGTAIDDRGKSKADALWDGQRLYIASHIHATTAGPASTTNSARLYRYSYNPASKTYSLDSGFPVTINSSESETLVMDKDSTGQLWITWVESGKVKVNRSLGNDLTWGTPFDLPVQGNDVNGDDISSVVAFGGNKIGIMWSNQNDLKTYFAVHLDSDPDEVWQPREVALADVNLGAMSDDHINMKVSCDGSGNIYAVAKTGLLGGAAPTIVVLKRTPAGVWTYDVFGTRGDHHTRPIMVIDRENQKIYVFARSTKTGPAIIYMKSANLNNIQFPPGVGTPFIESALDDNVNDPTSTKQCVDATTGLLVLASDRNSRYYLHNHIDLSGKPDIHFFTPISGVTGTEVTITGTHFNGATAVAFNGVAAGFTVDSEMQIRATVPASATTGNISIANAIGTGQSANVFTVILPPSIASFTPSNGPEGTEVTITGNNLNGATGVTFNGTVASNFTVDSNTQLRANVPSGATTGKIRVTNAAGTAISANNFTVTNPPIVSSFAPGNGPAGTEVTVTGSNFVGVTAVAFNGTSAAGFTVDSSTQLRAVVPTGTTTGKIHITNADGTGSSATNFVVTQSPGITSFTPASGPVGTQVTITGSNFTGATAVAFNGTTASFTVNSSTQIRADVPFAATTGKISVTNSAGTGLSVNNFVVTVPPAITSFAPASGSAGMEVTITGSNFADATQVAFNGAAATSFTIDSNSQLRADVPIDATTGKISVINSAGTGLSMDNFIVAGSPTVSSFIPSHDAYVKLSTPTTNYGTGSTLRLQSGSDVDNAYLKFEVAGLSGSVVSAKLRLYVTNPSNDGGAVYVVSNHYEGTTTAWTENGLNWNNAPAISGTALGAASATSLDTWIELDVTSAIAGDGNYSFGLKSGSSDRAYYSSKQGSNPPELVVATTMSSPPVITAFAPANGPIGTEVTISGSDLASVTNATFNGTAATNFVVDSDAQIRAIVPATAATGKISVTAPAGSALSATDFTVTASSFFTFTPSHDAYVRLSSPMQSYSANSALLLRVTTDEAINTYLKFDVSGLGWPIENAKLRLYVTNASDDGGGVYLVSNNYEGTIVEWAENGLNWNNAPVISGSALSAAGSASLDNWVELDVTAAILGNGSYSFGLKNTSVDVVNYSSKEGSHPPELIIQTGTSAPPGPAISAFTPASGSFGTEVTISGTNLGGVTAVAFNSTPAASFSVDSPTQIRAIVPATAATGKISVTAPAGSALSATDFTVTASSFFTFTPSHDAYVRFSSPMQNFGAAFNLLQRVTASELIYTYLKFDISALNGAVQSATLRLYVTNASDDGGAVYSVSNQHEGLTVEWTEGSLNWNNAPAIGAAGSELSSVAVVSVDNWIEFDVTAAITGNGIYSFALKNNSSDVVNYSSKEGSHPPELVIRTSGGSPASKRSDTAMQNVGLEQTEGHSTLQLTLHPNHPNPFNAQTVIEYTLPFASSVQLVVYNAYGQTVRRLVHSQQPAGHHRAVWDGKDERGSVVSSGIYYYRLKADNEARIGQMTIVK
jgi:hypothetical protein